MEKSEDDFSIACSDVVDGLEKVDELVVYFFKSITTMNPTFPRARAVAVHQGRIVSIGDSLDDVQPWIKRAAAQGVSVRECWDFSDKVAYPGFIEPHCHPLIGGTALQLPCIAYHNTPVPNGPDIPGCKTKAEVLERLREEEKKLTDAGSAADLLVWGWDTIAMKGAHLTARDLDEISTTRVIAVWDCSMHNGYVNTPGLQKAHLHSR